MSVLDGVDVLRDKEAGFGVQLGFGGAWTCVVWFGGLVHWV